MVRSHAFVTCSFWGKVCHSPVLFAAPCLANVHLLLFITCLSLSQIFIGYLPCILQVIVITGDNKLTAEAICRKVGVFAADEDLKGKSITGVEFMKLPLDKRRAMLQGHAGACFSRAEPKHKQVCGLDTASTFVWCCPAMLVDQVASVCIPVWTL